MKVRLFTDKDLEKIPSTGIVDLILEGITLIEQEIKLNELSTMPSLLTETSERKIKLQNLISLLNLLITKAKGDPLTGKILMEARSLLPFLQVLKENSLELEPVFLLSKTKSKIDYANKRLNEVILYLELWKQKLKSKFHLPIGNVHTHDTYHPEFPSTYKFKPSYLPEDYRSNFFFEVRIKEFCPFTTTITFHPFSEYQSSFQDQRSVEKLTLVDVDVEFRDDEAVESIDNIRAFRVHGPNDSRKFPGSYLVIKGGHHRTRALYKKYILDQVDGDIKILVQLVTPKDFPDPQLMKWVNAEILRREALRVKI